MYRRVRGAEARESVQLGHTQDSDKVQDPNPLVSLKLTRLTLISLTAHSMMTPQGCDDRR